MPQTLTGIPIPDYVEVPDGFVAAWEFIPTREAVVKVRPVGSYVTRRESFGIDDNRLKTAFRLYQETAAFRRIHRLPPTFLRWHERFAVRFVIYVDKLQARLRTLRPF